ALSTHSLHLDIVGRYQVPAIGRLSPWVLAGFGRAWVYTDCTDGGQETCGADPKLPTEDHVGGWSVPVQVGVDIRILDWLSANAALEALSIVAGAGHICGQGACATSPGTRMAVGLLLGA